MKISSPYSPEINAALKENLPALEFSDKSELALPSLPLPLRIGEILDYIESSANKILSVGNFKIDCSKNMLSADDKTLNLTEKETAILKYLAQNRGISSRDTMLKTIWGYSENVDSKTVGKPHLPLKTKNFSHIRCRNYRHRK